MPDGFGAVPIVFDGWLPILLDVLLEFGFEDMDVLAGRSIEEFFGWLG
jgi:hypothetical protein